MYVCHLGGISERGELVVTDVEEAQVVQSHEFVGRQVAQTVVAEVECAQAGQASQETVQRAQLVVSKAELHHLRRVHLHHVLHL